MDFNFEGEVILEDDRVRLEPLGWDHFELLIPIALANPNLHQYSTSKYDSKEALKNYFAEALKSKSKCMNLSFFDSVSDESYTNGRTPSDPTVNLELSSIVPFSSMLAKPVGLITDFDEKPASVC